MSIKPAISMSTANFIPEIWARELLYSLKNQLVGTSLVNRNYQGEITSEGDTVHIQSPSAINTGDYTGSDITFQALASTTQALEIDQAKYFAFLIDDVDQAQANVPLMQSYMGEASYSLAKAADTFILEAYSEAAASNVISSGGFTDENAYEQLTEAGRLLSESDVPDQGRYIVVDPAGIKALSNDPAFLKASDLGDQTAREGFMGRAAGFDVFMSNNLITVEGTGEDPDTKHYLFGHPIAITYADQILKTEAGRREAGFSDFVKGLHVYGKKVVRPTALGTIEVPQS